MGLRERHARQRQATARAILDAARELFVSEGYLNVSMRKIAERVEYSPAAIYRYFPGKDDIFFSLAEEGFRLLFDGAPSPEPAADPLDRIRAMFWHYYDFSKRHPEYFALMFVDRSVPRISRDWERFGFVREMKREAARTIQQCIERGVFPAGADPEALFRLLAASVHGPAVMRLCDRLLPGEDPDALAHDALETTIGGLRSGVRLTLRGAAASERPADAGRREPRHNVVAAIGARPARRPARQRADRSPGRRAPDR